MGIRKSIFKKQITAWMFLIPGLIVFILFVFYPIITTVFLGFTEYNSLDSPNFVGIKQFATLFGNHEFWISIYNSILLTIGVVASLTILPLPIAYIIQKHIRKLGWVRAVCYIPFVTPIIVSAVAWKWLLSSDGLINYFLLKLHLVNHPVGWLSDPDLALWSVLIVVFWRSFGFYLLIYISGLVGIPNELYEAASIDGAGNLKTFFKIVVPLLKNTISLVIIVSFINAMKVFDEVFIMTNGGPANASETSAFFIYKEAFGNLKFGYSSAVAVVLLIIVVSFMLLALKLFEKDEVKY